jgi:ABC-type transport system substrate-binding protein
MSNRKMAGLLAASAVVAVTAAMPAARAQMMAPMQPPPDRVDVYSYSDAPKAEPGDSPANWSARQNVADSDRYERLIRTNPAFRDARIRKECGSINEPDLYQQCVATFH